MTSRSPAPGCLIGIAALTVFVLLAVWTVYTGYTQNKKIARFTQPTPADLQVTYRDPDTVLALRNRVRAFGNDLAQGSHPTMELTVADLNDLIRHEKRLLDLREMIAFTEVGKALEARIALPMQTLFQGGRLRYLNGTVSFLPLVEEGQPMLKIVRIHPDKGGQVPEGFLNFVSGNLNLLAPFREDKQIGPVLKRVTSIGLTGGRIELRTD